MGILDRGLATAKGLRALGRALSDLGLTNEIYAHWVGVRAGGDVSGRSALRRLGRRHVGRSEGIAVWFDYRGVRGVHPFNFQSCYHEHGYKTRTGNYSKYLYRLAFGGSGNRSGLQAAIASRYSKSVIVAARDASSSQTCFSARKLTDGNGLHGANFLDRLVTGFGDKPIRRVT